MRSKAFTLVIFLCSILGLASLASQTLAVLSQPAPQTSTPEKQNLLKNPSAGQGSQYWTPFGHAPWRCRY